MSYKIEANPELNHIRVTGEGLRAFSVIPGAQIEKEEAILPFAKATAEMLFDFLKTGQKAEMSLRTKAFLRILKDGTHEGKKGWQWDYDLHTMRDIVIDPKGRKLRTAWDLIHYMPLRYIDKSNPQNITDLTLNNWSVIVGQITSIRYMARADATIVEVRDITGTSITSWFFRQRWLVNTYHEGDTVVLSGTYSQYTDKRTGATEPRITNASIDPVGKYDAGHKVAPIYSEKVGKKKWVITKEIEKLLANIGWIMDPVPEAIIKKYDLMTRNEAYRKIHFPDSLDDAVRARERIAFDDFVRLQVFLLQKKANEQETRQGNMMVDERWSTKFVESLPFEFTGAQKRVVDEIRDDMAGEKPMRRLLHGDVGSGKTEVSLTAALRAARSGFQVALLAPTSILAVQLAERFEKDVAKAGLSDLVKVGLLHTGIKTVARRKLIEQVKSGEMHILIGTHSILNKEIDFHKLGLIIIDEQHRFGTRHRQALTDNFIDKSPIVPDVLMMSATPIPRTMSQTIYGDMDLSVIDEYPADRKPVATYWDEDDSYAWESIREEVGKGHQAYVIASLVDESESEKMENVENATQTQMFLQTSVFPDYKVGLVHGKMKPAEKSEVLDAFYRNEINVLVSTTVIEVGVNVPNATVMTILNANRFGIASLHQIRGRVGRGSAQGYCHLIGEATNPDAEERLNAMVASNDGFWLAEKDLEIRGEGSLMKDSQHGDNDMIVANLREHKKLLEIARRVAKHAAKSPKMQDEVRFLFQDGEISS